MWRLLLLLWFLMILVVSSSQRRQETSFKLARLFLDKKGDWPLGHPTSRKIIRVQTEDPSRALMISTNLLFTLLLYSFCLACGVAWEIKTVNGESWWGVPDQQRIFAMSLEDYNGAFASAAYCLRDGILNGLTRGMCTKCYDCEWKLRKGFTTEKEWRVAVIAEMTRLSPPREGGEGKVGTWIVEAPPREMVKLDTDFIAKLEVSLQLSLRRLVKSETHHALYFVVSGKLEEVCLPLLNVGFQTCTPRPSILKIHPALLFEFMRGGADSITTMDIQVSLAPLQQYRRNGMLRAHTLANEWSGVVATSVGHMKAFVRAESEDLVTIQKLTMVEAGDAAMSIASQVGEVDLIYPVYKAKHLNDYAASVVQGGDSSAHPSISPSVYLRPPLYTTSYPLWDMGIHGEGQIIAVADTGLDWNHCFFQDGGGGENNPGAFTSSSYVWESTTHRKIRQYATWGDSDTLPGTINDHGTHVCGTVAGIQEGKDSTHKGIAYAAKLAFFDIDNRDENKYLQIPQDMHRDLLPIPYRVGARIHSNSWGNIPGEGVNFYDSRNRDMDRYMYENQDFVVVVAAGNGGKEPGNMQAPGTAKSVITVGASENLSPVKGILRKYYLLKFSSRGPTPDGRIKPDVCAPGVVTSARSVKCLVTMRGTSMSTPVVAGVTALVRQYFMDGYYPDGEKRDADTFIPMGALLKAVVVNSAQRMIGLEATRQGEQVPNMDQGFGLVTIDSTLTTYTSPQARKLYVDGEWTSNCGACPRVYQDNVFEYAVKISPRASSSSKIFLPLKVTLVWSDYTDGGSHGLVHPLYNDLDLIVKNLRNGAVTYSNGGSGLDTKNPVEHITISAPQAGSTYAVRVSGAGVSIGPQPYAIVISGPFEGAVTKRRVV